MTQQVLIAGQWRDADFNQTFQPDNPSTREPVADHYPVSQWSDIELALDAANRAFELLRGLPGTRIAGFLERYAERIENRREELVEMAFTETALPRSPRLNDVELPRTTNQLRQAAAAARSEVWRQPIIDTQAGIRACRGAVGPVAVFGPNNFPFAFNSAAGGDFAAALAAGNPVLAKANSSHPGTTRLFAEEAAVALQETDLPNATLQLIYRTDHHDGERLVADHRLGATGYTGSRTAGLKLKQAADRAGNPIYLELSSVNPVVLLPGAIAERADEIANEFATSCLMGTGQFCTNPGLVLMLAGEDTEAWLGLVKARFEQAAIGILLSQGVESSLSQHLTQLMAAGATVVTGHAAGGKAGFCYANTLLRVTGSQFLESPSSLQTEAFGNASLVVVANDLEQLSAVIGHLEGNLTGCVYSHRGGGDDAAYDRLAGELRQKVGRLLNDKMPTGVAVSPAMNHGGPFPATAHAGFTAVGLPGAVDRFTSLWCYDEVRPHRLPKCLRDENPDGLWRSVDGAWTQADITPAS